MAATSRAARPGSARRGAGRRPAGRFILTVVAGVAALLAAGGPAPARAASPPTLAATGIQKIQHIVLLTQENRSFDNYFGTYPGADGIPAGVCLPDPLHGGCVAPFHDPYDVNYGGPHHAYAFINDLDGGKMDGFVRASEYGQNCNGNPNQPGCSPCNSGAYAGACVDVMGYHDAREIPNYWAYAQNFALQDHMFEAVRSWSWPAHVYGVSGWDAQCSNPSLASTCTTFFNEPAGSTFVAPQNPWTDITYLLYVHHVSWGYYVFKGNEPDCEDDAAMSCAPVSQGPTTPGIWNPLLNFDDVHQDGQTGNIQSLTCLYQQIALTAAPGCRPPATHSGCGLPSVSWVVPNSTVSEHPPSTISAGQAFVTTTVNAIMRSPCWQSTAIFLTWDDWGGFYDHVVPPTIPGEIGSQTPQTGPSTPAGYGFRVPGLLISPYARAGYIDHQTLSSDAYLRFIEDDFLGGERICAPDPTGATNVGCSTNDGRPDPRPDVRENAAVLGDLTAEFNFNQPPRSPLILPTHPAPGPASCPPGATCPPSHSGGGPPPPNLQLTVSVGEVIHVSGRRPAVTLVIGCNLPCRGRTTASLSLVRRHHHLQLRPVAIRLRPHAARTFRLRLPRADVRAIRTALRHHRRVWLTIRVAVRSGAAIRRYAVRVRLLQ